MGKTILLAAAICFSAFSHGSAAPSLPVPVPGRWKGASVPPAAEFSLEYDARVQDGRLSGTYVFSSGPAIVKGSFTGAQTNSTTYSVRIQVPAGVNLPQFNVVFPDPQAITGTIKKSAQPDFSSSFVGFPDLSISARILPSADGKRFAARWQAIGLAGTAVFQRLAQKQEPDAQPQQPTAPAQVEPKQQAPKQPKHRSAARKARARKPAVPQQPQIDQATPQQSQEQ